MPGFLDRIKSGADKAAFEADRLVRLNQAQAAVRSAQRGLEAETGALGREVLALYGAGTLIQPELLPTCQKIDGLRQQVAALEAEVVRIREEQPPGVASEASAESAAEGRAPASAPTPPTPGPQPPAPVFGDAACPNCRRPLRPGVRFCPDCGTRVEDL
jgi:hypothetical protein